jgi:hypothetical protein
MLTDKWQPIETAPKDGTSVLVFDSYQKDGTRYPDGRFKQTGFDGLERVVARFTYRHGWHVSASVIAGNFVYLRDPQFWMPLPLPPMEQTNAD